MCIYSAVFDKGYDSLKDWPMYRPGIPVDYEELKRRVKDLEDKMEKAAELDVFLSQPDCESEKKKDLLKGLADRLGIKIKFPKG